MSAERALLAAIRAHAGADADVKAALGNPARLYDQHPRDPVFPFVTIERVETTPADAADAPAFSHAITLNVWSRESGKVEALSALSALRAALHDAPLVLTDWRLVLLRVTASGAALSADARTVQGVLTLSAITEPA